MEQMYSLNEKKTNYFLYNTQNFIIQKLILIFLLIGFVTQTAASN